ncbi:phosphoribosylamine--glycine ligase [Bdellovibrio sp. qaytius]|nr:phosphoribosylamine--glycine ligase [Bdellovibrio sp. qaytius]
MRVLIVGSGGREHALAWKISQSAMASQIFIAPGNAGMFDKLPNLTAVDIKATDVEALAAFALKEKIDLTVVGPENVLEKGLKDVFSKKGLKVFGPSKAASQLESSKTFAKEIMQAAKVPTAEYQTFKTFNAAVDFIERTSWTQMVVKADGLAAGKGVVVCANKAEAFSAVKSFMVDDILGFKVNDLLIEEFLVGPEVSVFALSDGNNVTFLGSASDHKRLRDNDLGPNTGGMGVIAPSPYFEIGDADLVMNQVMKPVIQEMKNRGTPFAGVLFAGLMKTFSGYKTLEFNVRFGDPETQALMPLIDEDILPLFLACSEDALHNTSVAMKSKKAIHVVMAASGYPGTEGIPVRSGDEITLPREMNGQLFFAGVAKESGVLKTAGGRVLGVTAVSESYGQARSAAYADIAQIKFADAQFRTDIGGSHD